MIDEVLSGNESVSYELDLIPIEPPSQFRTDSDYIYYYHNHPQAQQEVLHYHQLENNGEQGATLLRHPVDCEMFDEPQVCQSSHYYPNYNYGHMSHVTTTISTPIVAETSVTNENTLSFTQSNESKNLDPTGSVVFDDRCSQVNSSESYQVSHPDESTTSSTIARSMSPYLSDNQKLFQLVRASPQVSHLNSHQQLIYQRLLSHYYQLNNCAIPGVNYQTLSASSPVFQYPPPPPSSPMVLATPATASLYNDGNCFDSNKMILQYSPQPEPLGTSPLRPNYFRNAHQRRQQPNSNNSNESSPLHCSKPSISAAHHMNPLNPLTTQPFHHHHHHHMHQSEVNPLLHHQTNGLGTPTTDIFGRGRKCHQNLNNKTPVNAQLETNSSSDIISNSSNQTAILSNINKSTDNHNSNNNNTNMSSTGSPLQQHQYRNGYSNSSPLMHTSNDCTNVTNNKSQHQHHAHQHSTTNTNPNSNNYTNGNQYGDQVVVLVNSNDNPMDSGEYSERDANEQAIKEAQLRELKGYEASAKYQPTIVTGANKFANNPNTVPMLMTTSGAMLEGNNKRSCSQWRMTLFVFYWIIWIVFLIGVVIIVAANASYQETKTIHSSNVAAKQPEEKNS